MYNLSKQRKLFWIILASFFSVFDGTRRMYSFSIHPLEYGSVCKVILMSALFTCKQVDTWRCMPMTMNLNCQPRQKTFCNLKSSWTKLAQTKRGKEKKKNHTNHTKNTISYSEFVIDCCHHFTGCLFGFVLKLVLQTENIHELSE